ncbi:unnamed protein product [Cylindrotheca closterium]|uniref:PDZ domain-containing protein n=1 Tax=Cylindrotheca closterium TaxID=2856 RepID=A0AAD2CSK8_9STRA|nr:unnamed protein product [Cylindrotheca closterium]
MTVVKVAVNKRFRRSKLGLKFSQQDESSPLIISKISEGGLFDETPLVEGLVVLKINDEDVTWMSPKKADSILHKTKKGRITVTAEGFVGKIVRQSIDEKIGIVLHKPRDSSDDIFIWQIKGHSKFAGTDLKPGMKIITINGYQCPSSPTEAVRLMQRTIGKLKIVAVEVNRPKPLLTSPMQIRVQVNSINAIGSSQDDISHSTKRDVKETVSIVPSSITSVSAFSNESSKNRIRQRVKAVLKPLVKGSKSMETDETTQSSAESNGKQSRRKSRKKSNVRLFQKTKPKQEINIDSNGDIPDLEDPVGDDGDEVPSSKILEHPARDETYSDAVPFFDYIPILEFQSHKVGEPCNRNSRKKSKISVFRKTKPKQGVNIVSYGDISDSEDTAIDERDGVQSPVMKEPARRFQDHANATSSSDFVPSIGEEPFEELISATKQVIHYFTDKVTINADPDSPDKTPFEDLTLLTVMPVADDDLQTSFSLPVTDENALTELSIVDDSIQTKLSIVNDNIKTSLSIVDDNATLFGEDISVPPDFVEEEEFPIDEDAPPKNQPVLKSSNAFPPTHPLPVAYAKLIPPKYPRFEAESTRSAKLIPPKYSKIEVHSTRNVEAKLVGPENDGLKAPFPLKHEHGMVQDIGSWRLQESQASCPTSEEDEIIEQIEGDSYDLDEDASMKPKLDPPLVQQNGQSEKPSTPCSEGLVDSRGPQMSRRRGIDPSEGGIRESPGVNAKKLEPPGFRAGVKEPKGRRRRDPESKSSSQESKQNHGMRQDQPETVRLQKQAARSEDPRNYRRSLLEQPKIARLQKPPVRRSSNTGCSFFPEETFIPQEVFDEMQSDFNSFWDRQKNYVESSWASLVGVM